MTSPSELAYAAGIVDGEGCITVRKRYYTPRLRISMRDPEAVLLMGEIFNHRIHATERWYTFDVVGRKAFNIVNELLPYLRVKEDQAKILLTWDWERAETKHEIYLKLIELHRRSE